MLVSVGCSELHQLEVQWVKHAYNAQHFICVASLPIDDDYADVSP